jgi:hypothetical protein
MDRSFLGLLSIAAGIHAPAGATTAESWWSRLAKLSQGRLFGLVLTATRERLQEVVNRLGARRLVNLGSCPLRRKQRALELETIGGRPSAAAQPHDFLLTRP